MKLSQINDRALRLLGTFCMSRPVAAIGATTSAITTTSAIISVIDGIIRNVAALTNQALVSGAEAFRVQPANTTIYYVMAVNAAGTVRTFQGRFNGEQFTNPTGMNLVGDGTVPDVPDEWCPFALLRIATGATTFTPGTTALNAANVTTTIFDVAYLPAVDRP